MEAIARRADRLLWVALALVGLGLSVLLVYAWAEVLNNPGYSLADGYWIGRIPWAPLGVVLVLAGTASALVAGTVAITVRGDWVRRLIALAVLLVPIAWWVTAMGLVPLPRYRPPDPLTLAYSLPMMAAVMLIVPTLAIATLAVVPIRRDLRVRLRPISRP